MHLPQLKNTAFAKGRVNVENKIMHLKNIRKHTTKGSNSLSLLTFLH